MHVAHNSSRGYACYGRQRGTGMLDDDIVAIRQPDGRYIIRRWQRRVEHYESLDGHDASYDEADAMRRLRELRSIADTWVVHPPDAPRLVE